MDSAAKQQEHTQLLFTPLMISMVGITATASALLIYHFILTRFCLRYRGGVGMISNAASSEGGGGEEEEEEEAMRAGGVDDKVLHSIPVLSYSIDVVAAENGGLSSFREDQNECAVCLGELKEGEKVRLLPSCRHVFHLHCIDHWFRAHSTCPLCRSAPSISLPSFASSSDTLAAAPPPIAGIEEDHGGASHHDSVDDNESVVVTAELTRPRSKGVLLRHSLSLVLPNERSKSPILPIQLKRSLSSNF